MTEVEMKTIITTIQTEAGLTSGSCRRTINCFLDCIHKVPYHCNGSIVISKCISNDNAECTIKSSRRPLEARDSSMSGAKTVTGLVAAELT